MKILVVAEFGLYGGTRTYLEKLLALLSKRGDSVVLASKYFDNSITSILNGYNFRKHYLSENRCLILKYVYDTLPIFNDIFAFSSLFKKESFDRVIITVGSPGKYLGACIYNNKVIYVLHTSPRFAMFSRWFKIIGYILSKYFLRNTIIIPVSNHCAKGIITKWGNIFAKLEVVKHYFNVSNSIVKKPRKNIIVTIGQVEWYKNPNYFVKIAKKVLNKIGKNVQFYWIGDGLLLGKMVNLTRYDKNIHFVGYKNQKFINKILSRTSVYFQPSLIESFGYSVGDAMSKGVPCVVSDSGGLPELMYKSFALRDQSKIIYEIVKLLKNKAYWTKNSKRVKKTINDAFSYQIWENTMSSIIDNEKK